LGFISLKKCLHQTFRCTAWYVLNYRTKSQAWSLCITNEILCKNVYCEFFDSGYACASDLAQCRHII
jgi:hypothetical protein